MKKFILTLLTVAGLATEMYAQKRIVGIATVN
jgi:hypothetical protein